MGNAIENIVTAGALAAGSYFTGGAFGAVMANLSASLVLSTAAQTLLRSKAGSGDARREIARPTSLPAYRAVYGRMRIPGTPAPWLVKDRVLYGCLILNSRPSQGPFTVFFDQRQVSPTTGNPYDFGAGGGALATDRPWQGGQYLRYWIGRGDQTQPPQQILDEAPELFEASDAWRGLTVLWVRLLAGPSDNIAYRWPSAPPSIEVEGDWSLVWDPRNPSAPAAYSANQALCALDALMTNPVRRYTASQLLMESWIAGADLADEVVARKDGSLEPRYTVGGVLIWTDAELEDQVDPLVAAGAGRLVRVGGALGYVPGCWIEPSATLTDMLDDAGLDYQRWAPADDLPTSVIVTYTSAARRYEDASLASWPIPGAQAADGGIDKPMTLELGLVTSPTQAMRVRKIEGLRRRMQRRVTFVSPGAESFNLIGGSTATLALPAPYAPLNRTYSVERIHPGLDPVGQEGVAMRCALVLTETTPSIYAYDPGEDEEDIPVGVPLDTESDEVPTPGALTFSSVVIGKTPALRFAFLPADSALAARYEWEWRRDGESGWRSGGEIAHDLRDGSGNVYGTLTQEPNAAYHIRVRTETVTNQRSEFVTGGPATLTPPTTLTPPPTITAATGGAGRIDIEVRAPNDPDFRAQEVLASSSSDPLTAVVIHGPTYVSANATEEVSVTALSSGDTLYLWARSIDRNGARSVLSAMADATAT